MAAEEIHDAGPVEPFDERRFYLAEFRGRAMALAPLPGSLDHDGQLDPAPLLAVIDALGAGEVPVVVLAPPGLAEPLGAAMADPALVDPAPDRFASRCWRGLRDRGRVLVPLPGGPAAAAAGELAARLRVSKLVFLDSGGGVGHGDPARADDLPSSFVDIDALGALRQTGTDPRGDLLAVVERTLDEVPSVNLCTAAGLEAELFTYSGSGTLFSRRRYVAVRRLGLDDLDVAHSLIAHGVREGYLLPRRPDALDRILGEAFGAFIEDRHLAGICGLVTHDDPPIGELVCVYTLTRFQGEGIGRHLIDAVAREAAAGGLEALVTCTTQDRAARYFERQGFARTTRDALPPAKWEGYDPERLPRVRVFRRPLEPETAATRPGAV